MQFLVIAENDAVAYGLIYFISRVLSAMQNSFLLRMFLFVCFLLICLCLYFFIEIVNRAIAWCLKGQNLISIGSCFVRN